MSLAIDFESFTFFHWLRFIIIVSFPLALFVFFLEWLTSSQGVAQGFARAVAMHALAAGFNLAFGKFPIKNRT